MDDFVDPVPERLPLSGGQFVDIKQRLNHGETEDMYARIAPHGLQNRREVRTAKIDAYLLGWSLTKKGVPVPMSPELPAQTRVDTIRALHQDRAVEIYDAIEAHEEKMAAERAAQKKILDGKPVGEATLPSPSAVGGPSRSKRSER